MHVLDQLKREQNTVELFVDQIPLDINPIITHLYNLGKQKMNVDRLYGRHASLIHS